MRLGSHLPLDSAIDLALRCPDRRLVALIQQVFEKRAIVDHRLTKIFSRSFALPVTVRDHASGAIILDYARVVHGQIGHSLIEVDYWIASCAHDVVHQMVALRNRSLRIVDEL